MSSDRRKSKFPKRCEEFNDEETFSGNEIENCVKSSTLNLNMIKESENVNHMKMDESVSFYDLFEGLPNHFSSECKSCSIELKDWKSAVTHMRLHRLRFVPLCVKDNEYSPSTLPVNCMLCHKVCQNVSVLASHARSTHAFTHPPYLCPFCGRNFHSTHLVLKHIDITDVISKCPVCNVDCSQEYELYSHFSNCLPVFHPHVKSLSCSVCHDVITLKSLPDHMICHSQMGETGSVKEDTTFIQMERRSDPVLVGESPRVAEMTPPTNRAAKEIFLCEICDRRFDVLPEFRSHLAEHTDTNIFCPICFLKGFENLDFLVRHLVLRCPKRSKQQLEFGAVVSTVATDMKMNFLQIIKKYSNTPFFKEGLQVWSMIPVVIELSKAVGNVKEEELCRGESPPDVELLLWLSQYEKGLRDPPILGANKADELRLTAEKIRQDCPGVVLLRDVDVDRLKPLYDEAIEGGEKRSAKLKDEDLKSSFERLEWEAQYLRKLEPFYVKNKMETLRTFSPLYKKSKEIDVASIDPEILKKLELELKPSKLDSSDVDEQTLDRLLIESKESD